jgi:hypothetical protein
LISNEKDQDDQTDLLSMATSDEKFKELEDKIGQRIDYVFMQAREFTDTEYPEFL